MKTAISELEKQLQAYWLKKETRKTWDQWKKWFAQAGLILPASEQNVTPGGEINYQNFLSLCQKDLYHFPEWLKKMTDPEWLQAQNLVIFPGAGEISGNSAIPVMQDQIKQLSHTLKQLQQQVNFLESRISSVKHTSMNRPSPPQEPSRLGLQKAQMMEKELIISQSAKNPKPVPELESVPAENKIQLLEEIYLSFSDWVHQFLINGMDLQELASSSFEEKSKRRISFGQFGRRLETRIDDRQKFKQFFQQFSDQYADGFIPEVLPEELEDSDQVDDNDFEIPSLKPFVSPPEDLYRGFNDWLEWLKEYGIDAREFSSQELNASSTRQISFQQFCRRLERNLDDVESFRKAIQNNKPEGQSG
ncbi:MAG: hypothetical protein HQM13_19335 [SAR324 cluster bacterium]|nr:hypothetical protein [SAR324 cluster bacterium]